MKIWCDVCNKKKATLFCSADEAALCDDCDTRVHQANKLASKHQRFSLLDPSSTDAPTCDICQDKKALLFCQQDRAILCRDCDASIHTTNEHTQKHTRFLLTGIKLSTQTTTIKTRSDPNNELGGCTSSISEYLIDILPGWRVEDLLDSSLEPDGFFKGNENDLMFLDSDLGSSLWVPQAAAIFEMQKGEMGKKASYTKRMADNGAFTVPEMNQQQFFHSNKRSRPFY